ncbi:hypothetical protein E5Q_05980 [Mixia osmundae IAM 14324]|uniref:SAM-dependent MTase RsmB/NOP-type domain-containing protein n=1 Tax=Mixia osmundae (strain CBS 9802 / IAM 14324 / JCM 22182 / KY 12970) TaxID=764103 RepID=G7E9G6_MIXOS|nr:hypothetical protein E5Q_05980 [Mixia osmundae IAM 14324]
MDFYVRSASIIDKLNAGQGSLKGLATLHDKQGDGRRLIALVIETLKYWPSLQAVLAATDLLDRQARQLAHYKLSERSAKDDKVKSDRLPKPATLAAVLAHDLLFSKKGVLALPKSHRIAQIMQGHAAQLRAEKERLKIRTGAGSDAALQVSQPSVAHGKGKSREIDDERDPVLGKTRWMRINLLRWTVAEALDWLAQNGWQLVEKSQNSLQPLQIHLDGEIPSLLAFSRALDLVSFAPYQDGRLIAQDKASCMPAHLLLTASQRPGLVIDATAAPGNKTTMLAAGLPPGVPIMAFERDRGRVETLKKMCNIAGCGKGSTQAVRVINHDFMKVRAKDLPLFEGNLFVLVDPSCSGSGIRARLDHLSQSGQDDTPDRLKALSGFQTAILSHAMRLPRASRIVYSTCSIHREENEDVVMRVLAKPEFVNQGWELLPRSQVLPSWTRRGLVEACKGSQDLADGMIRCDPAQGDDSNGFFVAVLTRTTEDVDAGMLPSTEQETLSPAALPASSKSALRDDTDPLGDLDVLTYFVFGNQLAQERLKRRRLR